MSVYNRLETVDDGVNVTAYGYDAEGNLTLKFIDADENGDLNTGDTEITEYVWDHRNRLVSVTNYDTFGDYGTTSSQEVDYVYDYLNRLIARTIDADGDGVIESPETEYYVYDGGEPGKAEQPDKDADVGQIVLQLDENGSPTHRYLWGEAVDQILADEVVDDRSADDVNWTLTDHQNSVRDLVVYDDVLDEASVINHIIYDSYGNANAAVDCLFGYTGRLFDSATGLQNNLNRWYDPEVGRWLSTDPIGFEGGDANLYRYVANDPGNGVDPSGLAWWNLWICDLSHSLGDRIGTGYAAIFNNDLDVTFKNQALRSKRIVEEMSDGRSCITPKEFAETRNDVIHDGLTEAGQDAVDAVDGTIAAVELGIEVGGIVSGGMAAKQALKKVGKEIAEEAGKAAARKAARPFGELIKDVAANPSKWQVVKREIVTSTNIRNKGGRSIQEVLRNSETGEEIVRHTLLKPDGTFFEPPHFRPFLK